MLNEYRRTRIFLTLAIAAAWTFASYAALAASGEAKTPRQIEKEQIAILKSDASRAEKDLACRQLRQYGTADAIPALAALLPDKELSHLARYALEPMDYPEAGQALRDAVGKASGNAKIGIIHSLGLRRDKKAVAALVPLLKDDNAQIAAAAAWSLAHATTPKAVQAIARFRAEAKGGLKPAALDASLIVADYFLRQGKSEEAAAIYEDLRAGKWPAMARLAAFNGLVAARPDKAHVLIAQALAGDDPLLKKTAIAHIGTSKDANMAKHFAAQLSGQSTEIQVLLIDALSRHDPAHVRTAIAEAAGSESPEVRTAAVRALGKVGDASDVRTLGIAVSRGKSDEEKQEAITSLRLLKGQGVDRAIARGMHYAPPEARVEIIEVLRRRRASSATPELLEQAADADANVRKASFRTLGSLGAPKDLPVLVEFLTKLNESGDQKEAERAVVAVARKISNESARADAPLAALNKTDKPAVKSSLLRVLQGIANPKAFQAVRAAADDKNPVVRDAAVRALADWPDARAVNELLRICGSTDNQTHRVVALRGCVRQLSLNELSTQETLAAYRKLMGNVQKADEKKLAFSGLAKVADPATLKMIAPYLKDEAVKAEAELATLSVARSILQTHREQAGAAAKKLLGQTDNQMIRREAQKISRQIEQLDDYITAWQVAGPYRKRGWPYNALFGTAFPPEEKAQAKFVTWDPLAAGKSPNQPWMLNLLASMKGTERVAYVRTWVHADKAQPARIEFGTDDGHKLWFNDRLVDARNESGVAKPGEHKVDVQLRKGWNALQLKITQDTGPWGFCLRLRAPGGEKIEGLRVQPAPPAD